MKGEGSERERERERERETSVWGRNIRQLPPICTQTGDGTRNLGMCPDQESNPQSFGVRDDAPTKWATGQGSLFLKWKNWVSLSVRPESDF